MNPAARQYDDRTRLRHHGSSPILIEAEGITPDNLAHRSRRHRRPSRSARHAPSGSVISSMSIWRPADRDPHRRRCAKVKHLGHAMKSGRIVVAGNAGMHAGTEMTGGESSSGTRATFSRRDGRWADHVHGNVYFAGRRIGDRGEAWRRRAAHRRRGRLRSATMRRGLIAVGARSAISPGQLTAGSILSSAGPASVRGGDETRHHCLPGEAGEVLPTFTGVRLRAVALLYLRKLAA